ncbi:hypothetical protein NQ318_001148 [Aromia moschata]|uniref:Uncharacterized protein n=1 Tax=Aromia moschata TaxID=1265417 RepID=A0AAV8ZFN2_9CUCU|nr:hypothetical protein NQ318_001148 [Aromia moschata]
MAALPVQRRRPSSDGADGKRQPRGGLLAVGILPAGPATELPPVQPVEEVPVGAVRWHRLPADGHPAAPDYLSLVGPLHDLYKSENTTASSPGSNTGSDKTSYSE